MRVNTKTILMNNGMTEEEADEAVAGLKRGLKDIAAGRVTPLSQVKKELGLDDHRD